MLNVLEPDTEIPYIGVEARLKYVYVCRGHFEVYFYDEQGNLTETIDMVLNIEKGQWLSMKCLESGTILFESKDGVHQSLGEDEIMFYRIITNG